MTTPPKKGDRQRARELLAESERLQHDLWTLVADLEAFTEQLQAKLDSEAGKEG